MTTEDIPTIDLTDEQITRLCHIFLSGFVSGAGTLAGHIAAGDPPSPLAVVAAQTAAAHHAHHIAVSWLEDPLTRHKLRDDVARLFNGQVAGTEVYQAHIHHEPKAGDR